LRQDQNVFQLASAREHLLFLWERAWDFCVLWGRAWDLCISWRGFGGLSLQRSVAQLLSAIANSVGDDAAESGYRQESKPQYPRGKAELEYLDSPVA
jgi:hypothetical protein